MAEILVVDDDNLSLEFVKAALKGGKHAVFTATDWAAMNHQLTQRRFPVIVMDVNLPGLKGDQLAEIVLRRLTPPPVVILWSAMSGTELRETAKRIGVQHVLTKSISREHLARVIENALREFELKAKEYRVSPSAPPAVKPRTDPGAGDVPSRSKPR